MRCHSLCGYEDETLNPGTVSVVGLKVLLSHPCRCMPVRFSVTREMCRLNFCNETLQIKNGKSLKFTCV